jgi:hypothetical protein
MDNITDGSTLTSGDAKALADKALHPELVAVAAKVFWGHSCSAP